LARLIVADPIDARAEREAKQLANALKVYAHQKQFAGTQLFGPVPPFFHRIDGRYRWQIIVRTQSPANLLKDFQVPPNWIVDIDPVSTL
jgi:primosomal protein N' (replication factor Y)